MLRASGGSSPPVDSTSPLFCGILEKQPFHASFGGMFTFGGTKKRYFVLFNKGGLLRYYKNEAAFKQNPNVFRSQVVLTSTSTVVVDENSGGLGFCINVDVSVQASSNCKRELHFKSIASAEDASAWVAAIRSCIGTLVNETAQIDLARSSHRSSTMASRNSSDLPFEENSIDELLFAIWAGSTARVEFIVAHFPWLITERGNVFEKRKEIGYARVKESTLPLVAAMERQNADMTKILLRAGAKAEAERASIAFAGSVNSHEKASFVSIYRPGVARPSLARPSLAFGSSGFQDQTRQSIQSIFGGSGQLRASLGFHPNRIDKKFRESLFEMKLEAAKSGWKPMNKLDLKYIDIMVDRCGDTPDAFMVTRSIVREIERNVAYRIFIDVTGKPHLIPNEHHLETFQEEDAEAEKETVADSGESFHASPISMAIAPSKASRRLSRQEVHIMAKAEQDALLEQDPKVVTSIHSLFPTSAHGGDSSSDNSGSSKAQPLIVETERVKFLQVPYDWRLDEEVEDANGNIFGKNSVLVVDTDVLRVPCNIATKENVAFFNAVLLEPGGSLEFELPDDLEKLPLTLMDVRKT